MKSRKLRSLVGSTLSAIALIAVTHGSQAPAQAHESGIEGDQAAPEGAQTGENVAQASTGTDDAVLGSSGLKGSATPVEAEGASARCPAGSVEVEGDYCTKVEQKCLRWLDPDTKMRCAEFSPNTKCVGKTMHKHFCIDRYEYPNKPGVKPVVMKTWYEAKGACEAQGKRLCGSGEWTLACEGQERLPYPYGYVRSAEACNIDKPHPDVDEKALANPKTRDAEAARLDQRDASAQRDGCVSPFGVHDMTGNVDEWVVNDAGHPFQSGLKGGYWGPVRTRCRPMTTVHSETFSFYQIGFRCCADPGAGTDAPSQPAGNTGHSVGGINTAPSALTGI